MLAPSQESTLKVLNSGTKPQNNPASDGSILSKPTATSLETSLPVLINYIKNSKNLATIAINNNIKTNQKLNQKLNQKQQNKRLIPIYLIGNRSLIFNIKDMKYLSVNHSIVGQLCGTLPLAPQQNVLLGFPWRLTVYEVLYLLYNNICYLVDGKTVIENYLNDVTYDDSKLNFLNILFEDELNRQREEKKLENELRLERLGLKKKHHSGSNQNKNIVFMETLNDDSNFVGLWDFHNFDNYFNDRKLQTILLNKLIKPGNVSLSSIYLNFKVFNYLKLNYNHCLLPGMRFGGKFVSYPGDPLRYHSHLIVDTRDYYNDDIGLLEMSNRGRLATGVKKLWLIAGEKKNLGNSKVKEKIILDKENVSNNNYNLGHSTITDLFGKEDLENTETVCFSVEWAGFG